ncbi:MAG: glycerophosphodiester phosphodiesterase [Actinobacteria bacterium]|nr:glycerophosphodiester phosphodiesterase [Actinomycetota bacterium]
MAAFRHAYELGYRHLETDVHATSDGALTAFHDHDLSRTCGRPGLIGELTWSEVARARVDGDHAIPLMSDLLEEFPDACFNIDAKSDGAVEPLLALLNRLDCLDRVCIGSFSHRRLAAIRRRSRVCTSASPREVARWLAGSVPSGPDCFQVPVSQGPITVVTARSVARAQRAGKPVHVWTIDDPREMQRLIDLGVDGIMTDDATTLERIARANGLWPNP